jgi:chromosome partitioning protein
MNKILAIFNNKGGVGKTTTVVNLAGVLAKNNKRVLIIDVGDQGNCTVSFGANPDDLNYTLFEVLTGKVIAKEAIIKVYENIEILPSNGNMGVLEMNILTNLDNYDNPTHLLKDSIEAIQEDYDIILIDCPPNLGLTMSNVLNACDTVLIPHQPEHYSARSLQKVIQELYNFIGESNPNLKIHGVVGTLVDIHTNLHKESIKASRTFCEENDIRMFDTYIPKSIEFPKAVAYHSLPATLAVKKENHLVDAYYQLYKEVFKFE